jgi:hypothetical protein
MLVISEVFTSEEETSKFLPKDLQPRERTSLNASLMKLFELRENWRELFLIYLPRS